MPEKLEFTDKNGRDWSVDLGDVAPVLRDYRKIVEAKDRAYEDQRVFLAAHPEVSVLLSYLGEY